MRRATLFTIILALCFPIAAAASIHTDLQYGAQGSEVKELQEFLASEGFFEEEVTGRFYSITLAAVKAYQTAHGISATGFVGPLTRAAINGSGGAKIVPAPLSSFIPEQKSGGSGTALEDLKAKLALLLAQLSALQSGSGIPVSQTTKADTTPFDFNSSWRDAIVNILCTSRYGGINDLVSGSGVVVDPRGIILTNAHVAHAFLFAQWPNPSLYQCSIRVGSPAAPRYHAALLYIPDAWMKADIAGSFKSEDSTVYGEHDFALLAITGPTSDTVSIPDPFPHLSLYLDGALPAGSPVYLSGYPAENLGGEAIQRYLYQLSSPSSINETRTIPGHSEADVITIVGNIASQHGSSGGAIISRGGEVAGLITFLDKNYGSTTASRVLNAITTDYISRDIKADTGRSLQEVLATHDPVQSSKDFMAGKGAEYQKEYGDLWKSKGFVIPGLQ